MALSRCIETRLLEAVLRETKACFEQATLGLVDDYSENGELKIWARPFGRNEIINPYAIMINPIPPKWTPGVSGVGETTYAVEALFIFPFEFMNLAPGANSFLDHVHELRQWLVTGGTWPNNNMAIEDPDNADNSLAWLHSFAWEQPSGAEDGPGIYVPVLIEFLTRENESGARA